MDSDSHTQCPPLLAIPLELRQQIYEFLFQNVYYRLSLDRRIGKCYGTSQIIRSGQRSARYKPSILLSCRQCYEEARHLLFKRLAVGKGVCNFYDVKELSETMSDHFRLNLRRLEPTLHIRTNLSPLTLKSLFPNLEEIDFGRHSDYMLRKSHHSPLTTIGDDDLLELIFTRSSSMGYIHDFNEHSQVASINAFLTIACEVHSGQHRVPEPGVCTRCHGDYDKVGFSRTKEVKSANCLQLYTVHLNSRKVLQYISLEFGIDTAKKVLTGKIERPAGRELKEYYCLEQYHPGDSEYWSSFEFLNPDEPVDDMKFGMDGENEQEGTVEVGGV